MTTADQSRGSGDDRAPIAAYCLTPTELNSINHPDAGAAATVALDQRVESGSIGGVQPDAAMGCRSAEPAHILGAVNGVAAIEEHRIRHRRVLILAGIVHPLQILRTEAAARRVIAAPSGRHLPDRIGPAIDRHIHSLR
jgi:hypothetical protein